MLFFKSFFVGLFALTFSLIAVISCKKTPVVDPCAAITCLNGGTCNDGSCQCPQGFIGESCSAQKTPSAILIKSITVTKFPSRRADGTFWDVLSGAPDIYPNLKIGSSILYSPYNAAKTDVVAGQAYKFTPQAPIRLTDMGSTYTISVYDADTITDEWMGGIDYKVYTAYNKFPTSIEVSCPTCSTGFTLEVSYEF